MGVIELGERAAVPVRREPRPRLWRPVVPVAALLALLTLGGSASPLPEMRLIFTTEQRIDSYLLTPDALLTAEPGTAGFDSAVVRRFGLGGDEPIWSADPSTPTPYMTYSATADALLLQGGDDAVTIALDAATGRELWRSDRIAVRRVIGDGALVYETSGERLAIQLIDLRTGTARWTTGGARVAQIDPGDPRGTSAEHVVLVGDTGRVAVLGATGGAVLGSADFGATPAQVADEQSGDTADYTTAGEHLYVSREEDGEVTLTAYDLPGLKRLWENTAPSFRVPSACGRYVCLATETNLTVLDAETGAEMWSATDWRRGVDTVSLDIPGPSRIAVGGGEVTPTRALVDPATGRILTDLGEDGWLAGPTLLQSVPAGGAWIRVPAAGGALRTVGRVEAAVPQRCRSTTTVLVCPASDGRLSGWQLPDR